MLLRIFIFCFLIIENQSFAADPKQQVSKGAQDPKAPQDPKASADQPKDGEKKDEKKKKEFPKYHPLSPKNPYRYNAFADDICPRVWRISTG